MDYTEMSTNTHSLLSSHSSVGANDSSYRPANTTPTASSSQQQHPHHLRESAALQFCKRYGVFDWLVVVALIIANVFADRLSPSFKIMSTSQFDAPDLAYPLKTSIIPDGLLIFLAMILPLIVFFLVFIFRRKQAGSGTEFRICLLAFIVTIALTLLVTTFGKKYIGRPRPDFVDYSGYQNENGQIVYNNPQNVDDAYQSFPSGHSSLSFGGLGFLAMWCYYTFYCYWRIGSVDAGGILSPSDGIFVSNEEIFARRKSGERTYGVHNNLLWVLLLCTGPLWLATFIAFSRVRDFHHNYGDILAGSCIGLSMAYFCYRVIFIGRRQEWLRVNQLAFEDELKKEQEHATLLVEEGRANGRLSIHPSSATSGAVNTIGVQQRSPPLPTDTMRVPPAATTKVPLTSPVESKEAEVVAAGTNGHHSVEIPSLVADSLRAP